MHVFELSMRIITSFYPFCNYENIFKNNKSYFFWLFPFKGSHYFSLSSFSVHDCTLIYSLLWINAGKMILNA